MAHVSDLPCDGDGVCMICKATPPETDTLTCKTCVTPWHVRCLSSPPETLAAAALWECPDCTFVADPGTAAVSGGSESAGNLVAAVRAIESDESLTEQEKAKRRQELVSGGAKATAVEDVDLKKVKANGDRDVLDVFDESLNCSFCMQLPDRPVTNDPDRKQGVLVGETWEDRMECRQWGAHLPHVAGIAGQSDYGAQSVALSGGYEDDEDHGEWFLYTGSGGRDLSGNKRTNKTQSFDQKFDKMNEALRVSCRKGYPVRVVRSHKEKRSSYAPETGVRYDGIYRIEKCWRKVGIQGFKVCRYLFVRCDNAPAPWTSDDHGDHPRPLPTIPELKNATDITERKGVACWDYDEEKVSWLWKKSPPESRKQVDSGHVDGKSTTKVRRHKPALSIQEKLLKEFSCVICRKVMSLPLTTPCAHNFCKACLENAFSGQTFIKERTRVGGRALRAQKNVMKCPSCSNDISDFLQNPQVNRELMGVIESLQRQSREAEDNESSEETNGTDNMSDVVPADTQLSNVNSDIVEEEKQNKEGIENSPSKIQPEETHKLKKESGRDCIENPLEQTDAVSDNEIIAAAVLEMPAKESKGTEVDNKSKRTNKRKANDGICSSPVVGVKTRSRKAN
ncbi:E3 ubiquitin-protein like [Actinidia chinensis var. chinensis]|uniref:RING-type E3 ubiquitin transferase n=1 Tax=Actinidia chinensis var. chinensis TaxID=1590841 RepID=A0A2R6QRH5_ACTCC|nr:E3 ubiquitin-protein like [Actinidia chinensis var. chinensis]